MLVLIGMVVLICALTPLAVRWASMGMERMRVNRLFNACASHQPTEKTAVWEEDPATRDLIKSLPDYNIVDSHNGPVAYGVPQQWKLFNAALGGNIQSWGTLFLHELRTPAGERRLIGIDVVGWSRGGPVVLFTRVRNYSPAAPMRLPKLERAIDPAVKLSDAEGILRIFPGQPDSADASHFTINFTISNRPGVIDGWLKIDGSVLLEPRLPTAPVP
jgi:hypothetical protein